MKPEINAIPLSFISDDMTNGDVILNIFNCMILTDDEEKVWVEGIYFPFDKDWWISPYRGGKISKEAYEQIKCEETDK